MRSPFQFVLDLFETAPPLPVPPKRTNPRGKPSKADPGPQPQDTSSHHNLPHGLGQVQFAHPQANRAVVVQGVHIAYAFARGKRKTIGFSVGLEGLTVHAPQWVSLKEVDAALQEKSAWILRKLSESRERKHLSTYHRIEWQDGAWVPYLGRKVMLRIDPTLAGAQLVHAPRDAAAPRESDEVLLIGISAHAQGPQIRDCVQAWLMRQARRLFESRLNHFAAMLGVHWQKLSLSNAGTRWGSARADGSIRLNWRLIHLSLEEIDYVVVHELSHLRVMNHSPQFWDTVRSVMPDYSERRERLQKESLAEW